MSPGYIPLHAFLIYLFKSSMFRISYIFVTEPFLRETPRNIFCTKRNGCERMKSIDVGMTNMDWVITWTELSKQPHKIWCILHIYQIEFAQSSSLDFKKSELYQVLSSSCDLFWTKKLHTHYWIYLPTYPGRDIIIQIILSTTQYT